MKILVSALILSLSFSANLSTQWEILNEGTVGYPITMDFVSEDIGWILRGEGEMLKTIDGGQTWITLPNEDQLSFRMIDFLNDSVGWSIGNDNVIYKTENGGTHWVAKKIPTPQDWWSYSSIHVLDENHVFITGDIKIFKTTDSGTSWENLSPSGISRIYYQIYFLTPQIGMVIGIVANTGPMILRTTNGGSSWIQQAYYDYGGFNNFQFVNDSVGYFTTVIPSGIRNQPGKNILLGTNSRGLNWTIKTEFPFSIGACQFISADTAYAIMSDSISNNKIVKSTDGGTTWQDQNAKFLFYSQPYAFPAMTLNTIRFNKVNEGLTIGSLAYNSCVIYRTSDDGQNWYLQNFTYPFNDVHFFDSKNGIVFGGVGIPCFHCMAYKGEIFSTNNGSETWKVNYAANGDFKSSSFIDDLNGYCLTENQIYKTTDGAENWISLLDDNVDTTGFCWGKDIAAINEMIIYAVGGYCDSSCGFMILGTSDGGNSWSVDFKESAGQLLWLNSICFSDTVGWAVGEQGVIVKYTPNKGWTKIFSITDFPLHKVHFLDSNTGWIVGGYQNENDFQNILLKTINGGDNWNKVQNVPYLIKDIAFVNNNLGWAIGYDSSGIGGILKSTDGGNSWTIDTGNLSAKLNALYIKDGYGWAVGDNGLILRTTNAGPTWVNENNQTLPTEFTLEQNYPNPFNPITKIKYSIPTTPASLPLLNKEGIKGWFVTLKVYDILGREVATLVNEEKPPGIYEVEFDGGDLSSGIYLYRLTAGDFTAVRKAILLK